MSNPNPSQFNHVIVGFTIDVSGSMKQSIRNNDSKEENRFESFQESLKNLSKEAKKEIEMSQQEGNEASIDVFVYAFGLKDTDYGDLITLIELGKQILDQPKKEDNTPLQIYDNPYEELAAISKQYGIKDMEKYIKWGKDILNPEEAQRLTRRLHQYPRIAERLMGLLPESFSEVEGRVVEDTKQGAVEGGCKGVLSGVALTVIGALVGGPFGAAWIGSLGLVGGGLGAGIGADSAKKASIDRERKQLEKPESLARELANASSDDEVRKIIIREVGSVLEEELRKVSDMTLPLEEVADLLDNRGDYLEDIEPLIYGMTPMQGALKAVKSRFEKELDRLPKDTIPVLFILSDGQPTDGNPLPVTEALKQAGIHIVSCFVTNQNIVHPRKLFDVPETEWSDGARLMFNMASSIGQDSVFTRFLLELGWTMPAKPKLFVQVNHTEVLEEFIRVVLSPLKESVG